MTAQAKAAKDALELAIIEYKHSKSSVKKSISAGTPNVRSVSSKYKLLSEALSRLNLAHTSWVTKAALSDEQLDAEKYSSTWLETERSEVDDIQDQVDEIVCQDLPVPRTDAQNLQVFCNKMDSLQVDIKTKLKHLLQKTSTSANVNSASLAIYEDLLLINKHTRHTVVITVNVTFFSENKFCCY